MKKFMKGARFTPKNYSDEVEAKIQHYKREGYKLPQRHLLRTEEQLAGIRESAKINTALLDCIAENIHEGMSTAEIDHLVYAFTIEPMINMGTYEVFIDEADGWTVLTDDGKPSAQWESQILITETGNEVLTQ